ncbi:MAG: hypothetical protein ABI718_00625 [Acidobacteriota bacterium]
MAKRDRLRRRLGYLPQDFGVYANLKAREFLTCFAALKGVRSSTRVMALLELVNPTRSRTASPRLFGGMKQRPGIAQALVSTIPKS